MRDYIANKEPMIDSASAVENLVLVLRSMSSLRRLMPTLELCGELFNRFGCLVLATRRGRGVECCLELSTKFRGSFHNVQRRCTYCAFNKYKALVSRRQCSE